MGTHRSAPLVFLMVLLLPCKVIADAEKSDWLGDYSMNHDGWKGTLTITEIKADCGGPLWCDMAIKYQNSKGERHRGRIEKIDNKGQHMVFYIGFSDNEQKFDGYLFSWDKNKMAGTTYWGGRTFGFFATKLK